MEQLSLFDDRETQAPLASRLRPESLDEYVGQKHLVGKGKLLRQLIERVNIGRNFEIEVEFKISVTQFFDFLHPEGDKSVYYRAS